VGFLGGSTQKTHRVFFGYVAGCLNPDNITSQQFMLMPDVITLFYNIALQQCMLMPDVIMLFRQTAVTCRNQKPTF